jgi:hypothetical protein
MGVVTTTSLESEARKHGLLVESRVINGVAVVLVKRERCAMPERPYVTWLYTDTSGLFWGHYDLSTGSAYEDFARRCERELDI